MSTRPRRDDSAPFGSFIAELSRRRVFRAAGAYVAGGLFVIYAGDAILPRVGLEWAQTLLVVLVLLGLPLSLALAWAFDVTPSGIRRSRRAAAPPNSRAEVPGAIAVLPFDNMSPDPQDAYVADGLTEELTSHLSRLGGLRVISRTSATQLKRSGADLASIARELSIQYVLEGSVRKAGDALRITAQLIDAARDEHLWSESYSGTMHDVLGMQEQVARTIADTLRIELRPGEVSRVSTGRPPDLRAYQYYIPSRVDAFLGTEEAVDRALRTADAGLAALGESELLLCARGFALFQYVNAMLKSPAEHASILEEVVRTADRALALNPASSIARTNKAVVSWARGDVAGAVRFNTEALALDPNNPDALLLLGYWRAAGGWDLQGAQRLLTLVRQVDPLTSTSVAAIGWLRWFEGDFQGALKGLQAWWDASGPDNPWRVISAYHHAAAGDFEAAARIVEHLQAAVPRHLLTRLGSFLLHAWRGERDAALASVTADLEAAARWDDIWPLILSAGYAVLDERDRALTWLERAVGNGIMNVDYLRERDPFLASLRQDPRFAPLLERAVRLARGAEAAAREASRRSAWLD
jgi:serine/threonine-protein kinase